jgi:hypothetical protein
VDTSGSGHEVTQDVNNIRNVRTSDAEIDKTTNEVTVASGILKRNTVYGTKTSVKLHGSIHRVVISETSTIKIINILPLQGWQFGYGYWVPVGYPTRWGWVRGRFFTCGWYPYPTRIVTDKKRVFFLTCRVPEIT